MIELLDSDQMRRADGLAIAGGTPGRVLMERAGAAVAAAAERLAPAGRPVLVACGPGNNGGDGFVAARLLARAGREVAVALLGDREALRGDAALAASDWSGPVHPLEFGRPEDAGLVVDALFGTGLARPPAGAAAEFIDRVAHSGVPVLCVDVPSGLDADTGRPLGPCIRGVATMTFARRKTGHLLEPGRGLCGAVTVADIGISDEAIAAVEPTAFVNGPALWGRDFPWPEASAHKYTRGHVLVASGGAGRTGAARLAARAALRVGAGLVTLASPREAMAENAAHLTAIMLRPCDDADEFAGLLADARYRAAVIGPGAGTGEATRALVGAGARSGPSLVLDADALTSFAGAAGDLADALTPLAGRVVLTPHEGEFARLFGGAVSDTPSKLERARRAAALAGAVVLLKGSDTVVAAPDGVASIAENGTPFLATAGSGDVLSGLVAGLLAQGMPPFAAASAAVWMHGECGRLFGPGLIAEDLPETLPSVLRDLAGARFR